MDDPEGVSTELTSSLPVAESKLDLWLLEGAERFRRDAAVSGALEKLARHDDTHRCLILLGAILDTPDLVPRLLHVLRPAHPEARRREAAKEHGL